MNQQQTIQYTTYIKQLDADDRYKHVSMAIDNLKDQLDEFETKANLKNSMDIARFAQIEHLGDFLEKVMPKVGTGPDNVFQDLYPHFRK